MRVVLSLLVLLVLAGCGGDDAPAAPAVDTAPDQRGTPASPAVVWAVGDGANGSASAKALARHIARDDPDRVLYLGDVYETGTAEEFETNMRGVYRRLLDRMLPTPGNHEWPNRKEGYTPFWDGIAPWYAVRIGSWQVLSLNTEADHSAGSRQLRWLDKRLRNPARCRLAFWHRPQHSAGEYGGDAPELWDAVAGRVAVVLSGHDHNTQRFRPIGGTVQIVAGAGGRERYPIDPDEPRLAFGDDDHFTAVRMELRARAVRMTVQTARGRILDRARVRCPSPAA